MSINVLEHIADDVEALRAMREMCSASGRVAVIVPAHMSIFGELDLQLGHVRRYSRADLERCFAEASLEVVYGAYMNIPGYFGWGLFSRLLGSSKIPGSGAEVMNRLVPVVEFLERLTGAPFGQSLVMVGKPTHR